MKNKGNYLKEKGITLIALVVTIVVLLILAGVTINAVFSDNGIIGKAQDAQNKANESVQKDLEQINALENWINNYTKDNTNTDTNTTEPTEPTTPDAGEIIGTLDLPVLFTDEGDGYINPITAEMYPSELQSTVEKLNETSRTNTVKDALKVVYGDELPDEIYLFGQGKMKDNNVDVNQYKFLSPVVGIVLDETLATDEDQRKITFVIDNMTDNMTVDILYYCSAHGWEVIEGEKTSDNTIEVYLHDSDSRPGIPGALIYKLSN